MADQSDAPAPIPLPSTVTSNSEVEDQKPPALPSPLSYPEPLKSDPAANIETKDPTIPQPHPPAERTIVPLDSPLRTTPIHPSLPSILMPRPTPNPNPNPNPNPHTNSDSSSTDPTTILDPLTLLPLLPSPIKPTTTAAADLPPSLLAQLRDLAKQHPTPEAAAKARDALAEELERELGERDAARRDIERRVGEMERTREVERRVWRRGAGKGV